MKQDRKLLSREDHEIAYVRNAAKETLKWIHDGLPVKKEGFVDVYYHPKKSEPSKIHIVMKMNASTLRRLCKAVLKFAR